MFKMLEVLNISSLNFYQHHLRGYVYIYIYMYNQFCGFESLRILFIFTIFSNLHLENENFQKILKHFVTLV